MNSPNPQSTATTASPTPAVEEAPASPSSTPTGGGVSPNQGLRELAQGVPVGAGGLAPKSLAELMDFAQLMAKAGPMVGKAFREKPGACLAIAMQAMRWGMDPFAVSQKAYVINDTIAYEAQLVTAVINAHAPIKERMKPSYDGAGAKRQCTIKTTLRGESEPATYTSPEMGAIPTKNSPLWKSDPDQQLFYYSARMWARRYCPEVILGVYAVEEMTTIDGDYQRVPEPAQADPRTWVKASGDELKKLHADMDSAPSHETLNAIVDDFTSRHRCSENAWTGVEEMKARAHERIEEANAEVGAEDMNAAFAETLREE